jgi:hypothetical protein
MQARRSYGGHHVATDIMTPVTVAGLAGDDLDGEDIDVRASEHLHRRSVSEEQLRKFESYAAEIFTAFGLDLNTPATVDTPRRFIKAMFDVTAGYEGDPKLVKASSGAAIICSCDTLSRPRADDSRFAILPAASLE